MFPTMYRCLGGYCTNQEAWRNSFDIFYCCRNLHMVIQISPPVASNGSCHHAPLDIAIQEPAMGTRLASVKLRKGRKSNALPRRAVKPGNCCYDGGKFTRAGIKPVLILFVISESHQGHHMIENTEFRTFSTEYWKFHISNCIR